MKLVLEMLVICPTVSWIWGQSPRCVRKAISLPAGASHRGLHSPRCVRPGEAKRLPSLYDEVKLLIECIIAPHTHRHFLTPWPTTGPWAQNPRFEIKGPVAWKQLLQGTWANVSCSLIQSVEEKSPSDFWEMLRKVLRTTNMTVVLAWCKIIAMRRIQLRNSPLAHAESWVCRKKPWRLGTLKRFVPFPVSSFSLELTVLLWGALCGTGGWNIEGMCGEARRNRRKITPEKWGTTPLKSCCFHYPERWLVPWRRANRTARMNEASFMQTNDWAVEVTRK